MSIIMRNSFFFLLVGWTTVSTPANAEVRESNSMAEAFSTVDTETLLVLDIDNTLIESAQTLGSDQWYYYLVDQYRQIENLSEAQAYTKADKTWNQVQSLIPVRPVEATTPKLLQGLQNKGVKVLLLTARNHNIAVETRRQLASVDIDPSRSAIVSGSEDLEAGGTLKDRAYFDHGILYSGVFNDKGAALVAFLRRYAITPKRVIFVDDKSKAVNAVDQAVISELTIPSLAIRYGAADARVKAFDGQLADIQARFLSGVLSDEAAAIIAKAVPKDELIALLKAPLPLPPANL